MLILEDVHPYLEPQHHQIARWVREMSRLAPVPRRLLVLSTPFPGLPADLQKEVPTVELPLPGVEDLAVVADRVAETHGVPYEEDDALLEAARGLTVMEARLAFGQAAERFKRLGRGAVPMVIPEEEGVIRQSRVLEYYEPDARMTDVGGLENLKRWPDRRGQAFGPGARAYGLDAPKGVLLLGVQVLRQEPGRQGRRRVLAVSAAPVRPRQGVRRADARRNGETSWRRSARPSTRRHGRWVRSPASRRSWASRSVRTLTCTGRSPCWPSERSPAACPIPVRVGPTVYAS